MTDNKVALVTGASSGFGERTAKLLVARGYRVFGTSRRAMSDGPAGVEPLELDVRSDDSVRECIAKLVSVAERLDVLVNNAGRAHASVIEETTLDQAKDVFETNFWGVARVNAAVLPLMRRQRRGHIINVGSLAGLVGVPGQGFYSASKFALEGYSAALRLELESFNIRVSVIEPGFFSTNLHHDMFSRANPIADYAALRSAVESSITRAITEGGDPEEVAKAIVAVAESKSSRSRRRVGSDAVWLPRLKAVVPESLFRLGLKRRFKLP
jgi:NAD(P)-dependent dehydrogenase (short-subunit alcohol dehydrogenase family)